VSDVLHKELMPQEILGIFEKRYKKYTPIFEIVECHFKQQNGIQTTITVESSGIKTIIEAGGNGRLDAVSNALSKQFNVPCQIVCFEEHAMQAGSDSSAIAYVGINGTDGNSYFGIGIDPDIIKASIDAIVSAMNRSLEMKK